MRHRAGGVGAAMVEYAALVTVLATLIGSLLVLRPHRVGRVPLRPMAGLAALVQPPPPPPRVAVGPRVAPHAPPRSRRHGPRRTRPERAVVMLPRWLVSR